TPRILEAWAARHPGQIRTLPFRGSGIAAARDFAWRQATSPWVAFIDSDCEVQPGWADAVFEAMRRHAGEPDCAAFGGRNRVPQDGRLLYRAYALVLATYVGGHDSILNRPFAESRRVEHCPTLNVVYRRSALEEIAGFDPAYVAAGEDLEVTRRLRARGYSLWAHPGMVVEHALRPTLASWLRNMFVYGRGRCFHSKRHPEDAHPKFLAPLAVGLAYMMSAAAGPAGPVLVGTLHAAGVAALLLPESRRQRASIATYTSAVAITCMTHLAYAAGMLAELPRRKL
ncbi:MAG TPA: glycosyltransferase, partial [Terriglobales bacterium]|nr:glycosyltransferase [Terriglobales bacterium]